MNIAKKMIVVLGAITLFAAAVSVYEIADIRNLFNTVDLEMRQQSAKDFFGALLAEGLAPDIQYNAGVSTQSARRYALTGDAKCREQYEAAKRQLEVLIARSGKSEGAGEAWSRIAEANRTLARLEHEALERVGEGTGRKALNILESDEYQSSRFMLEGGIQELFEVERRLRSQMIQETGRKMDEISRSSRDLVESHINHTLYGAIICLGVVGLIGWLGIRSITRPIRILKKGVETVGQGNLGYQVGMQGKDEIAELSRAFDSMTASLKNLTVSRDELNKELSERTRIEENLRRSEEQLRAIFENSNDAMVLIDNGFIECNQRAVEMFGAASKAEFLKFKPEDISPLVQPNGKNSVDLGNDLAQKAFQDGFVHFDWTHRRANGEDFAAEVSFSAFDFRGRRVLHSTVRDVTERKKMEDVIRDREETFRTITESASDAIILIDSTGCITFWNPAAETVFGYAAKDVFGKDLHKLLAPEIHREAYRKAAPAFLQSGKGAVMNKAIEIMARHSNGSEIPIELTIAPLFLHNQWHAVGIARNIAERKKLENEMRQAREEAESASRMKSAFLANMSHEIRTPMNGILGMVTLLMDTEMSVEQRDFAETVRSSAESLLTIINDILDYSKVEAGQMKLETIDFDLRHCVEDVGDLLALRAQEKGLEFICIVSEDLPQYVCGDPGRIRQVLTNLLGNAVKFTQKGEVSLRINVTSKSSESVSILCEVRDTGIGIAPEDQKKLFRPFTQVDSSTARKFGGTGLGLSIARQLIELMGGHIGLESEPGGGTVFRFSLTLGIAERAVLFDGERGTLAGCRVLVVDDNETNRQMLYSMLSSWNCDCDLASDALSALERLGAEKRRGRPFDIALLDMQMPVITGEELGQRIKADPYLKETRLVMITSLGERGDAQRLLHIGFSGYLSKPVRREQLRRCMETVMNYATTQPGAEGVLVTSHLLAEQRQGSRKVLVVEDNAVNRKVARGMIEKLGFSVELVSNGREALEILGRTKFDLVIMDCQMPEMDGYEATSRLRNPSSGVLDPNVPVLAMTANAMKGDREKCLEAGMDDYVSKPVNLTELAAAIERWLDRSHGGPKSTVGVGAADDKNGRHSATSAQATLEHPDFDSADLLDRVDGDRELATVVLHSFIEDVPSQIVAFRQALAGANAAEGQRLAHGIKGACGSIGCRRMQELAGHAEFACRDGRLDDAEHVGTGLLAAFAKAENAIRKAGF